MLGSSDDSRRHDAEPKAALEAPAHRDGPLLLDTADHHRAAVSMPKIDIANLKTASITGYHQREFRVMGALFDSPRPVTGYPRDRSPCIADLVLGDL
jgi:hypothetical protein